MYRQLLCVLTAFALLSPLPVAATDLSKIDRTIGKEPAYASKPGYCLVAIGPEAKTRLWLVVDGDTLFTSGKNGELTNEVTERSGNSYKVRIPGTWQELIVEVIRKGDKPVGVRVQWHLNLELAKRQTVEGVVLLGDNPKSASVIHLDGSYASTLRERGVIQKGQWVRDGGEIGSDLHVYIGSNVLQKEGNAFVRTWWSFPGPETRPVADIEFPHQDPKAEPLKMRVSLVHR
jgi:hypothetical protein